MLRLKLEALVRSGGEKAANQAMEIFAQVLISIRSSQRRVYNFLDKALFLNLLLTDKLTYGLCLLSHFHYELKAHAQQ